jgi:hypothetical protein
VVQVFAPPGTLGGRPGAEIELAGLHHLRADDFILT